VRRSLLRLQIPLREPFVTAGGVVAARELAVIRLEDDDGRVGWGEAAPLEPYDGVSLEEVIDALRDGPPARGSAPQARAAWELAELDLQMRRRGKPLGEPWADAIPVNRTLPAGPPEEVAAAAAAGLREGFSCFKVKVGLPDDDERVAAVREAIGPWPALRVDANGAWEPDQAVEAIGAVQHVAISVDRASFEAVKGRLDAAGMTYLGPDRGLTDSIYVKDPDGIQIELLAEPLRIMEGRHLG